MRLPVALLAALWGLTSACGCGSTTSSTGEDASTSMETSASGDTQISDGSFACTSATKSASCKSGVEICYTLSGTCSAIPAACLPMPTCDCIVSHTLCGSPNTCTQSKSGDFFRACGG